jgi:uncharacterized delta-60 repeat protein
MGNGQASPVWESLERRTHLSGTAVTTTVPSLPLSEGMTVVASAAQPDGKVVVCGYTFDTDRGSWGAEIVVARLNADGTPDTTFGVGGVARVQDKPATTTSLNDAATAVAVEPDGDIVVAGMTQSGYGRDTAAQPRPIVVRFTPAGQLDTSFGGPFDGLAGGVYLPTLAGSTPLADTPGLARADAIGLTPDGGLVVAGTAYAGPGPVGTGSAEHGSVMVFEWVTAQGTRDTAYGSVDSSQPGGHSGELVLPLGSSVKGQPQAAAYALAVQSDGKVVVAGKAAVGSTPAFAVARTTADGSALDPAFGHGGLVTLKPAGSVGGSATDVLVEPDGQILAAGISGSGNSGINVTSHAVLARFNANGTLDRTFGTGGVATAAVGRLIVGAKLAEGPGGTNYLSVAVGSENKDTDTLQATPDLIHYTASGRVDTAFATHGLAAVGGEHDPDYDDDWFNPIYEGEPGDFPSSIAIEDDLPTSRTRYAATWAFPVTVRNDGRAVVVAGMDGSMTFTIAAAAPVADPAVTAAVPATSAAVTAGRTATVVVTVTNAGTGIANGPATLTLTADGVAVPLTSKKIGLSLAPGRSVKVRVSFRVPAGLAGQTVPLAATLTAGSGLADADATNDTAAGTLAVVG